MELHDLKKRLCEILSKCNRQQVIASVLEWGVLSQTEINYEQHWRSKPKLISYIADCYEEMDSTDVVAMRRLELISLKNITPSGITWYLYQLRNANFLKQEQYTAREFELLLQREVGEMGLYELSIVENHSALWGRLAKPLDKKCVYFIHHPFSDALLCNIKQNTVLKTVLNEAFKNIFDCDDIILKQLKSNDPNSIAQLYLHAEKSHYTYDNGYYKPRKRKRKVNNELLAIEECSGVTLQNKQKLARTIQKQGEIFGQNIPPSLQDINVHVTSKLKVGKEKQSTIKMDINFSGKNILNGFQDIAEKNLCSVPAGLLTNIEQHCASDIKFTMNG